jgi:hypothetical protein
VVRIDSDVVAVIDLDVMMAIGSGWATIRVEADNSDGVAAAGDRLGRGTIGIGNGSQLGGNGRNRLRCARGNSDRLGSDGGDRLGSDGGDGLSYDD